MIQLLSNKTMPHFQLLPMSKVMTSPYYAFMRQHLYSKRKVKEYLYSASFNNQLDQIKTGLVTMIQVVYFGEFGCLG